MALRTGEDCDLWISDHFARVKDGFRLTLTGLDALGFADKDRKASVIHIISTAAS